MFYPQGKIRLVLHKYYTESSVTVLRGIFLEDNGNGIKIHGRRYDRELNSTSQRIEEIPIDSQNKIYFVPYTSIQYTEIIVEGSYEDQLDEKIRKEPFKKRRGRTALDG